MRARSVVGIAREWPYPSDRVGDRQMGARTSGQRLRATPSVERAELRPINSPIISSED